MRYGLIAAAQASFVSSKSTLVCFRVSPVLSFYSQCNQSLKSPDRECAVQYLYLYRPSPSIMIIALRADMWNFLSEIKLIRSVK
jgi:hypothetical protein